jgi:hypothetical protein
MTKHSFNKMRTLDLKPLFEKAIEGRVLLDFLFLIFLITLCVWVFGGSRRLFGVALILITLIFVYNEMAVEQFINVRNYDSDRREYVLHNTTTPLQLPSIGRLALHLPIIVCGAVQYLNYRRGDSTYSLTREFGTSLITQAPKHTVYRALTGTLPRKMIYLMQHVGAVLDNLTFLQFLPGGYNVRVLNRSDANPLGLFPQKSRKHLFGAHFIDPLNPDTLKESLSRFVQYMVEDEKPTVYCIWPSGKLWNSKLENGVREFKPGAFYMSCYTGIPVSFVHTKFKGLIEEMIVEQTPLIYPPVVQHDEPSYISFYDNKDIKPTVLEFRDRVESVYRDMDKRLTKELALPTPQLQRVEVVV